MENKKKQILSKNILPSRRRLLEDKERDKCVTALVVKLESIFTSPDMIYLQQEDDCHVNPQEDDGADPVEESFMYFIVKGKFSIHVKTEHLKPEIMDKENEPAPVHNLIDGDHFGEIGMIFECKRTATVRSENYGSLAMLKKSDFMELTKTFEQMTPLFKTQIYKYKDELTLWKYMEMEKIPYFRKLSLATKQELIYSLERKTFEKGSLICKEGVIADQLILI